MNCPFCKGGPLVPLAPNSFTYKCPSCHRKATDLELEQLKDRTLDSARLKLYGGERGGGKTVGLGQTVAAAWEATVGKMRDNNLFDSQWLMGQMRDVTVTQQPHILVTSPRMLRAYDSLLSTDREARDATIRDIERAESPLWRKSMGEHEILDTRRNDVFDNAEFSWKVVANPDFTMTAADYERQKRGYRYAITNVHYGDLHPESPIEQQKLLMHELEKKLTGRQT